MIVKDSPVVLVGALGLEIKPILSHFKTIELTEMQANGEATSYKKSRRLDGGIDGFPPVIALISGIGRESASRAADWIVSKKPRFVMNLGLAGGLLPTLKNGQIFVPEFVRNIGGETLECNRGLERFPEFKRSGTLLTHSKIAATKEEKKKLSEFGDAVDMETFYLASALVPQNIPFFCIRVILDEADESLPLDFSPAIRNGEVSNAEVFKILAARPHKIFPLARLAFRSNAASRSLCRFAFSAISILKNGMLL